MDKRLIMTIGLPGSGKSTWAREHKDYLEANGEKVSISCKDDIRKAMKAAGWAWSQDGEQEIIKSQNSCIKGAFAQGNTVVIVADTNFGKHKQRLQGLAKHCGAQFEIKDFTGVPLETCIKRDGKRPEGERVGPEVIKTMHDKYIATGEGKPYVPDTSKPLAIICDLDGTIALHGNNRSPFDYGKVDHDAVNWPVAGIVQTYAERGYTILYTSGRETLARELTEKWLKENALPFDSPHMLIMRPTGDHRNDAVVKRELFDNYIREHYNVKFVLDDRDRVVKMWRDLGLCCLQVAYGNF